MLPSDISTDNIQRVLGQLRAAADMASSGAMGSVGGAGAAQRLGAAAGTSGGLDFGSILKSAVEQVSDAQQVATVKQQEFQLGESNMSLEEVMISLQKANLAFQGMIQVRNRLVEAYKEVASLQL
jgi:flagellar hook-basal body complex protein FliE